MELVARLGGLPFSVACDNMVVVCRSNEDGVDLSPVRNVVEAFIRKVETMRYLGVHKIGSN